MRTHIVFAALVAAACGNGPPEPQVQAFGGVISPTSTGGTPTLGNLTTGIPGTANGQTLGWDGTTWTISDDCADPSRRYCIVEDLDTVGSACATVGRIFVGAVQNGGTCTITSTSGHPSYMQMSTAASATGGTRWGSSANSYSFGGGAGQSCVTQLVHWTTLSTSSEEYTTRSGFGVFTAFTAPADGVYFHYDRAANGDIFVFRSCANSTCTTLPLDGTASTVNSPIAADTWYTVQICVAAAGTSATMTVNGTLRGTITTNIPLESASRRVAVGGNHVKSVGTSGRIADFDYYKVSLPFGVAR
jgi:hypothetical protein